VAAPDRSYFICTTPRSGSTLLSEALGRTELAGRPREYFQELPSTLRLATPHDYVGFVPDPVVREVLSTPGANRRDDAADLQAAFSSWEEYLASAIADGTTPSGIFAAKVMWRYFGGLLLRLRQTTGAGDDLALLERAFGPPRFVFLRRADKVGQAVSLWRAIQTWSWRAETDGNAVAVLPVYSFAAIDHLVRRLELDEADWTRWFRTVGVEPFALEYSDLAADYARATRAVLDFLDVPSQIALDDPAPLRRQADETSEHWADRYRTELAAT
jgi:trehalose 2-sulfotransferase